MKRLWLILAGGLVAALVVAVPGSPEPSPSLEPGQVVRIQVQALAGNGASNEGIALTYRFAAPSNRQFTGPLPRFERLVRSAPYARLLNHYSAHFGELSVTGDEATQEVIIVDQDGQATVYRWELARQPEGTYAGCWMTEAVKVVESAPLRLVWQHTAGRLLPALATPT